MNRDESTTTSPRDTVPDGGAAHRRLPLFDAPAGPTLLGMPPPLAGRAAVHLPDRGELSRPARELLTSVRAALGSVSEGGSRVFDLDGFAADERAVLWDMLGAGEVSIVVHGAARYEIDETALPGIFRVCTRRAGAADALHLEVGAVPAVVVAAAHHGTSNELPMDDPPPTGLMNARPLLSELRHRMATHPEGAPNHVISLSLLPLNDADRAYLARALGSGPVKASSRGYGSCQVSLTARRGIWALQYFNVVDTLILDTLEIGSVPGALVAAREDLEDSGGRLDELLGLLEGAP